MAFDSAFKCGIYDCITPCIITFVITMILNVIVHVILYFKFVKIAERIYGDKSEPL